MGPRCWLMVPYGTRLLRRLQRSESSTTQYSLQLTNISEVTVRSHCRVQNTAVCQRNRCQSQSTRILYVVGVGAHAPHGHWGLICVTVWASVFQGHGVVFQKSRDTKCDAMKVSDASMEDFVGNVGTHLPDYAALFKGP